MHYSDATTTTITMVVAIAVASKQQQTIDVLFIVRNNAMHNAGMMFVQQGTVFQYISNMGIVFSIC